MIMERKTALSIVALVALVLVSIPTAIFNRAIKKYFSFMGDWSAAAVKPSKITQLPPMHGRVPGQSVEPPQPELRFVKFSVRIINAGDVKTVRVAGDFNKWNPDALELTKSEKNLWTAILPLPPGVYQYLYYIDGQTMLDPMNPETAMHAGAKVSVMTVK